MRNTLIACVLLVALPQATGAQWLNVATPGIPRTADGKPRLDAPAPRGADGMPLLSGLWQPASYTYLRNIMADMRPEDVPFQPWATSAYETRLAKDDPAVRCLPAGIPRSLNNLFKIVQSPGVVTVLYEGHSQFREIFTDGRTLPVNPNPTWFGYSVGRWDGDVFVVNSAGFNDKTWLDFAGHPHSESLHLTERYHRKDFGHMDVQVTIDDAGAYTRPFSVTYPLVMTPDTDLIESICENHLDMLPRLVGTEPAHPPSRKSVVVNPQLLSRYGGAYEMAPGRIITVTPAQDRLIMRFPGNPDALTMFAESETRFFFTVRDEVVEFQSDPDGSVARLVIHSAMSEQTAQKVR